MAAGIQVQTSDLNNDYGGAARDLNNVMNRIALLYSWWQSFGGSNLLNPPYSMAQADINTLGSSITDMYQLYQLYRQQATLATAQDFTVNIKKIWGMGY